MIEAALNCSAEQIIEFTAYGQHMTRQGNRSPEAAPQGVYRCSGTERWLALSIATDEQWRALCAVLGEPGWATDHAFDTASGRHAGHDLLDEQLAEWAAAQIVEDIVERLVDAGVPAVVGWDPRHESFQPQIMARGLYEPVTHEAVGEHPVPGLPLRWTGIDRWNETPSPLLGKHNRDVLTRILGLTDTEVDELEAAGIIGDTVKT